MEKSIITLTFLIATCSLTQAQNPFKDIGIPDEKIPTLTLSDGQFEEFHDQERYVQIGSVLFDTETMTIAAVNYRDTVYSEATLEPEVISRWLSDDPLRQYASPYVGMGNDPINGIDPDGAFSSPIYDKNGNFLGVDSEGFTGDVLIMSQERYSFLSSMSENGVIDHDIASFWGANIGSADLSFSTLSSIYTDVVAHLGSEVDMSLIKEGGISIKSKFYGERGYNAPNMSTVRYSFTPATRTLTVNTAFQKELSTVETIQNMLGVHELIGHGMRGYRQEDGTHFKAYELQRAHPTFHGLTEKLQNEITEAISSPKYH